MPKIANSGHDNILSSWIIGLHTLFATYFDLGIRHIVDLTAFDPLLFIAVLVAVYRLEPIGKVAILVTAFTIGHSITLALATLDMIAVPAAIIEFLIPVIIFLIALVNLSGSAAFRIQPRTGGGAVGYCAGFLVSCAFVQ